MKAICLFAALAAQSAWAQDRCAPSGQVYHTLETRWEEHRVFAGLSPDGTLVETFANAESESWTTLVTTPAGRSCIAAAGQGFVLYPLVRGEAS